MIMKEYILLFHERDDSEWTLWDSHDTLEDACIDAAKNSMGREFMVVKEVKIEYKEIKND